MRFTREHKRNTRAYLTGPGRLALALISAWEMLVPLPLLGFLVRHPTGAAWAEVKGGAGPTLLGCEFCAHHLLALWLWLFPNLPGASDPSTVKKGSEQVLLSCYESKCVKHWQQCLLYSKCSVTTHCCNVVVIIGQLRSPAGRWWLPTSRPVMDISASGQLQG